ncbi:MAG: c-type cytochrome [Azoarcus sp.]|jgi:cytochrome c peroxidase|nr:c-type cytochrome [Azoarcus sp.]
MTRDRILLLYGFLTLLAAGLVAMLVLPEDAVETPPPSSSAASMQEKPFHMGEQLGAIRPIPTLPAEELQSGKALLGEKLFNDPQLSGDGTVSCATCHILAQGGDDGLKVSTGVGGATGDVNAPTVFNTVFNFRQFWDGRAMNLSEQVDGPLLNPSEMASNWAIVIRRLNDSASYRKAFGREYNGVISEETVTDALVRYETTLLTPNAPFDRFLDCQNLKSDRADCESDAITAEAREGYRRFSDYGCISCHQGVNIGGNFFQRFGVMGDYFADRGNATETDLGRYNITHRDEDRYVFKVPSLRNVAVTAPYFHDGSVASLDQAIDIMGRYQLGRALSAEDRRYIAAFLESLTGEFRGERLQP